MYRSLAVRCALAVGLAAGSAVGFVGAGGIAAAGTPKLKAPGAPTAVTVTPANEVFSVSWGTPTTDGGAAITGYTATATSKGLATESCTSTGAHSCVISGIVNPAGKAKNKYKVSVTATNSVGTGKAGKASGTFTGTTASDCSTVAPFANLQDCNLTGANLSGDNLTGAILIGATLTGVNLGNTNLTGADLAADDLTGVAIAESVTFNGADLAGADLSGLNLYASFMYYTNLAGADLVGADMSSDVLAGTNLTDANLTGVSSNVETYAEYADFQGANLTNADFDGVDFTGASLIDSNLTDTDVDGATLNDANLTGATLIGNLLNYTGWSNTICPDGSVTDVTCGGIPGAPTNVAITSCNGTSCTASWTVPAGNGTELTEYIAGDFQGTAVIDGGGFFIAGATGTTITTGWSEPSQCVGNDSCTFQISAVNNFGQGTFGVSNPF